MVASSWKGHEYIKAYRKPVNPNTDLQEEHRAIFTQARLAWKALGTRQKEFYGRIADGMSGYNVFLGRAIRAIRAGGSPETPLVLRYRTEDGNPVQTGYLIVKTGTKQLFLDSLKDARGEIALTPSDVPYTFVLRKDTQEDPVLTIEDLMETDVPAVLESQLLGIRLVLDVPEPPGGGSPRAP